jgi:N-acetylneuraminic acid mutarotase
MKPKGSTAVNLVPTWMVLSLGCSDRAFRADGVQMPAAMDSNPPMKNQMTKSRATLCAWPRWIWLTVFLAVNLGAQVPQIVRYQSTLVLSGTNYHGLGQFKFALVDPAGAKTSWSNDGSSSGGSEPQQGLELEVNQGSYEVFLGDTTLSNMVVLPPGVFTNANLYVRVWFRANDGAFQPVQPDQPLGASGYAMMAAQVAEGAITENNLADGSVTAGKLAAQAVTADAIALGSIGPSQLAPNAAAASLRSSGALALSDQSIATNLIAAGYRKIGTVAAETETWSTNQAFCPSPRANHVAAWTENELFIWGGTGNPEADAPTARSGALCNPRTDTWQPVASTTFAPTIDGQLAMKNVAVSVDGGVLVFSSSGQSGRRYSVSEDKWRFLSQSNANFLVAGATFVNTGSEVLVFGTGAHHRYHLDSDSWSMMSTSNAPSPRQYHTAVWTGTEMIVWGGESSIRLRTGARYNPASDTWQPTSSVNSPVARANHSAVWTGSKMMIWGGRTSTTGNETVTGGVYDPSTDTWQPMNTNGAPVARQAHFASWAKSQMLVFGGYTTTNQVRYAILADGARYNPVTRTWTPIATAPTAPLVGASMTWTGTELMVWGGVSQDQTIISQPSPSVRYGPFQNSGLRYDPATDQWHYLPFTPSGRLAHSTVWTGKELIVWGGIPDRLNSVLYSSANTGGRFSPSTGKWSPVSTRNAPSARQNHQAVWTGKEMIVWGGLGSTNFTQVTAPTLLNTGAKYNPVTDTWTAMDTNGAPSGREGFSLVWTGHEAIVFGGRTLTLPLSSINLASSTNNGAIYHPDTDQWVSLSLVNAPSSRQYHIGLWTGDEMIIWGGISSTRGITDLTAPRQGGRYRVDSNTWHPMSTNGVPLAATNQVGVWTGRQMLVFGGGARYAPDQDRWEPMAANFSMPRSPSIPVAVWTGEEMLVCPSDTSNALVARRYNPELNTWSTVTKTGAPPLRYLFQGAWTGTELLCFGGYSSISPVSSPNDVIRLSLTGKLYLYGHP